MDPRRNPKTSPDDEVLSRVRRVETRLTQLMVAMGIDTHSQKPRFVLHFSPDEERQTARIYLPSPHSSMKEILDNIPDTWEGPVGVFVGTDLLTTIAAAS